MAPPRKLDQLRSRKLCGYMAFLTTILSMLILLCFFFLDMEIIYSVAGLSRPAPVQLQRDYGLAFSAAHESEENSTAQVATPIVKIISSSEEDTEEVSEVFNGVDVAPQVDVEPFHEEVASLAAHESEENSTTQVTTPIVEVITITEEGGGEVSQGEDVAPQVGIEPAQVESIAAEDVIIPEVEGEEDGTVPETVESVLDLPREARRLAGCNISQGTWVFDNVKYPLYRSRNCPFADSGFRCEENGRPDKEFMSYHWQPHDCDLPRFNATDVLERLRGQRMVFVGDSLGRNTWESMMCMLAEGVADKTKIYEVNGEPITKHTGKLVYRFVDYDCTVEYYREPFLVPQTRPPKNSPANVTGVLRVDHVCWSADLWKDADYIIFNAGHWWTENKILRQGCRFQEGSHVKYYNVATGLAKTLQTWAAWLEKNLNSEKTQVFWLSFPTVHFRGGSWNRGGHCHQEKRPLTEEEARKEWQIPFQNQIAQDELMARIKNKLDSVTYLDITTATNYRPDGHGARYTWDTKKFGLKPRNHQDCSHFCLPGVPDAWNELILASLFAKGKGTWAQHVKL